MRRIVLVLIATAVCAAVAPAQSAPSADRGSYTVTAVPLPSWGVWAGVTGVSTPYCTGGMDGVHVDKHPFRAPVTGTLTMKLRDFVGDWELAIIDTRGRFVGGGGWNNQLVGGPPEETVVARVQRGQVVRMVACNHASRQTTVTIKWEFRRGLGAPRVKPTQGFRTLAAGAAADLRERVPVNIVMLGFDRRDVREQELRAGLPTINRPQPRMPFAYGFERPLGITYTYDYRVTYASQRYEDAFFRHLSSLAKEASVTAQQEEYNRQTKRRRTIRDNVAIDATKVEKWLALRPPAGVDTRQNTVFFLNWYGRKDFRFHIYRKTREPVTGTHPATDRGLMDYNALSAWGGTPPDDPETGYGATRRVWFYDLSAGPTAWTQNQIVDSEDVDDDGVADYRIPPSWEYGSFRDAGELTADLARITRYVAVNLLFTPSPLYDPAFTAPALPTSVGVAANVLDVGAATDAATTFDQTEFTRALRGVTPLVRQMAGRSTVGAADGRWSACYAQYVNSVGGPSCYPDVPYPDWANPFVSAAADRASAVEAAPKADYRTAMQVYVPNDPSGQSSVALSCFAFADDNWRDGTQSFVFAQVPSWCVSGIGLTDLLIHEFGHHVGLPHPHDGFDYATGEDYSSYRSEYAYVAVGDQVNSRMSYMWLNNEFSQFDRDNVHRWLTAAYLAQTNQLLKTALPHAPAHRAALRRADRLATSATRAFAQHRYADAMAAAATAYGELRALLRAAGVPVVGSTKGFTLDTPHRSVADPGARLLAAFDAIAHEDEGAPQCVPVRASLRRASCGLPGHLAPLAR